MKSQLYMRVTKENKATYQEKELKQKIFIRTPC